MFYWISVHIVKLNGIQSFQRVSMSLAQHEGELNDERIFNFRWTIPSTIDKLLGIEILMCRTMLGQVQGVKK